MKAILHTLVLGCLQLAARADTKFDAYYADHAVLPGTVTSGMVRFVVTGSSDQGRVKVELTNAGNIIAEREALVTDGRWHASLEYSASLGGLTGNLTVGGFDPTSSTPTDAPQARTDVAIGELAVLAAPADLAAISANRPVATPSQPVRVCRLSAGLPQWSVVTGATAMDLADAVGVAMANRSGSLAVGVVVVEVPMFWFVSPPLPTAEPTAPPPGSSISEAVALTRQTLKSSFQIDPDWLVGTAWLTGRHDAVQVAWEIYLGEDSTRPYPTGPEILARNFQEGSTRLRTVLATFGGKRQLVVGPWLAAESNRWLDRFAVQAVHAGLLMAWAGQSGGPSLLIPTEAQRLPFTAKTGTAATEMAAAALASEIGAQLH